MMLFYALLVSHTGRNCKELHVHVLTNAPFVIQVDVTHKQNHFKGESGF